MPTRALTTAAQCLRWLFALLLAVTGVAKLMDMPGFYAIVAGYQSLPDALVPLASWGLALGELALTGWLALGKRLSAAAICVIVLHIMYLGWLCVALLRGLRLENCGCFGVYWGRPLTWYSPLEDLALLLLAICFWRLHAERKL
jgi:hypothetical protein